MSDDEESRDLQFFKAGADLMRELKDAEIRRLEATIIDQRLQITSLYERKGWYCGCGHTNGINLARCAACQRDPAGRRPGK